MRRFKIELARDTRLIFTAWGLLLPQHYSLSVSVAVHTTTKTPRFTRKRCKMRYCAAILLFIALSETALAATCTYYRSSHRVTFGSVTCTTRPPLWWSRGIAFQPGITTLVDMATAAIGSSFIDSGRVGGYWDYHTKIPELGCRGGFALHPGSYSEGCITVESNNCYRDLTNVINRYRATSFSVYECLQCRRIYSWWRRSYSCRGGTNTISRLRTTDLQAV